MTGPAPGSPAPGSSPAPGGALARRGGAVVAALLLVATLQTWLTPFTAPGGGGFPFGCGSLAHPTSTALADRVCSVQSEAHAVRAVVLLLATGAAAAVAAALAPRRPAWSAGALAGLPVLAAGLVLLLSPLQVQGTDGGGVACGRPVAPAADRFSSGLCSDLPGSRLGAGTGLAVAAVLLGLGVTWVLERAARERTAREGAGAP